MTIALLGRTPRATWTISQLRPPTPADRAGWHALAAEALSWTKPGETHLYDGKALWRPGDVPEWRIARIPRTKPLAEIYAEMNLSEREIEERGCYGPPEREIDDARDLEVDVDDWYELPWIMRPIP